MSDREFSGNAVGTTLTGGTLAAGATSIPIAASSGWPVGTGTNTFVIVISRGLPDEEKVLCDSRSGLTLTVAAGGRGFDGTSAQTHGTGSTVEHCVDAVWFQEVNEHMDAGAIGIHPASAITNTPSGGLAATTVQGAINELDAEKAPVTEPVSVAHAAQAAGAHAAAAITFSPTGTIAASTVQAAIAEVATDTAATIAGLDATYATDAALALQGVPAGAMLDFGGPAANTPTGYLPCDGTTRVRTAFPALFAAIGTSWNTGGEAGTDFRLPNTLGRVSVGAGAGGGLTARTLGQLFGAETHQLVIAELASHTHVQDAHTHTQNAHAHGVTDPQHSHGTGETLFGGGFIAWASPGSSGILNGTAGAATNISIQNQTATNQNFTAVNQANGSGTAHNNVQPSAVVLKIIKT